MALSMLSAQSRKLLLATVALALLDVAYAAPRRGVCAEDPYLDPKNDLCNPFRYIPSTPLTTVALVLYMFTSLALFYNMYRWGAKYMLCMPLGGIGYSIGLALRYVLRNDPHSRGIFIAEHLFIILSPCAFIAGVYILLGRLAGALESGTFLLVPPNRVTVIFIASDVITFLIQAGGGGMVTSTDTKMRDLGRKILLTGLCLQLISFVFFALVFVIWIYRVKTESPRTWTKDVRSGKGWMSDWRTLAAALLISCLGLLVRSFFRVIENAEGWGGSLSTTESLFYLLDCLPVLLAIGVYVPFWPGSYIDSQSAKHMISPEDGASTNIQPQDIASAAGSGIELNSTTSFAKK